MVPWCSNEEERELCQEASKWLPRWLAVEGNEGFGWFQKGVSAEGLMGNPDVQEALDGVSRFSSSVAFFPRDVKERRYIIDKNYCFLA